ncbi:CBS domain-containing protein [Saccharopolyspora sp. NPDC050389]|uniref:CBS domain-containing protein n=1 Tax=Saccharopolyspora sp. NPDC050389 TaxID=3155516 RepID=UPI0033DD7D6F
MTGEQPTEAPSVRSEVIDLASTPIVAVHGDIDAMAALQEMYRNGVHHLAVASTTAPTGLVTAIDLLFGIAGRIPGEPVSVDSLCRRPAPQVAAEDSVAIAAHRMIEEHTDALLVISHGEIRGVLTAVDLVRAIAGNVHYNAEENESETGVR